MSIVRLHLRRKRYHHACLPSPTWQDVVGGHHQMPKWERRGGAMATRNLATSQSIKLRGVIDQHAEPQERAWNRGEEGARQAWVRYLTHPSPYQRTLPTMVPSHHVEGKARPWLRGGTAGRSVRTARRPQHAWLCSEAGCFDEARSRGS